MLVLAANQSTVAVAAEVVVGDYLPGESYQLTDAVIANLTALSLTNISLFDFASNASILRRADSDCKTFPGDFLWPNEPLWALLDLLTGGALIKTVPLASPCFDTWGNYDAVECARVDEQWTNSSMQ